MKSIFMCAIVVVVACAIGSGVGFGISWYEYENTEEHFFSDQWGTVGQYGDGSPGVVGIIGDDTHDFGLIVSGTEYRAEFIIENSGGSNIEISVLEKSDNVATDLSDTYVVKPGTTYPVEITLTAPAEPGEINGFVSIKTNDTNSDRQAIRLSVKGRIEAGKTAQ